MSTKKFTEKQKAARKELAKRKLQPYVLKFFIEKTFPKKRDKEGNVIKEYEFTPFHNRLLKILQYFIDGKVTKLILTLPPQHGKSEISTRRLIPFLIGQDPSRNIALVSYSTSRAARFGGQIKGVMGTPEYRDIFPKVILPDRKDKHYKNTSEYVDVPVPGDPGQRGNLFFVGRGGGLAGDPVDYLIIDDLYKNAEEAFSPVVRQSAIDFYDSVADARLHNESQQLLVTTRWHEKDIVGYIQEMEGAEEIRTWEQLENADPEKWYIINFEALKETEKTEVDDREEGEPLYPERHSRRKLEKTRARLQLSGSELWDSLYRQDPKPAAGLLYNSGFGVYEKRLKEENVMQKIAFVDPAEVPGKDFVCAPAGEVGRDNYLYLIDVVYTNQGFDYSVDKVVEMLIMNKIQICYVEGNAAGRAYAREINRIMKEKKWKYTRVEVFHQALNKEQRITFKAPELMRVLLMPENWSGKFPQFFSAITGFKKLFKSNKNDDGPDGLTGLYEKSGLAELLDPNNDNDYVGEWA